MKYFLFLVGLGLTTFTFSQTPFQSSTAPQKPAQAETVFLLGEVRTAQVLPYKPDLTLTAAVAEGGGVADLGATRIYLIRDGSIILKTNTRRVFAKPPLDDPPLKPKDVVYVGLIANQQ